MKKYLGITLVEVTVYLAILAAVMLVIMQFFLGIYEYNSNASSRNNLEESIIFLSQHFDDSFNKSTSLDVVNSVTEDNNGRLRLNQVGSGYFNYQISSGRLQFQNSATASTNFITPPDINVNSLYLEEITDNGDVLGVRVTINLNDTKDTNTSEIFETLYRFNL